MARVLGFNTRGILDRLLAFFNPDRSGCCVAMECVVAGHGTDLAIAKKASGGLVADGFRKKTRIVPRRAEKLLAASKA